MASRTAFWELFRHRWKWFVLMADGLSVSSSWMKNTSGEVQLCWFCSLRTAFPCAFVHWNRKRPITQITSLLKKQCTKNDTKDLEYSARAVGTTVMMVFSLSFWMFWQCKSPPRSLMKRAALKQRWNSLAVTSQNQLPAKTHLHASTHSPLFHTICVLLLIHEVLLNLLLHHKHETEPAVFICAEEKMKFKMARDG